MANRCAGKLVIHRDGMIAFCSNELIDTGCPGPSMGLHTVFLSCAAVAGPSGCPRCAPAPIDAGDAPPLPAAATAAAAHVGS